jgi:hypothetical protein
LADVVLKLMSCEMLSVTNNIRYSAAFGWVDLIVTEKQAGYLTFNGYFETEVARQFDGQSERYGLQIAEYSPLRRYDTCCYSRKFCESERVKESIKKAGDQEKLKGILGPTLGREKAVEAAQLIRHTTIASPETKN